MAPARSLATKLPSAAKHPVSVIQADIFVEQTRTTMRLTCFAEDLELLQGVEALENGKYDSEELLDAVQDHAKYLADKIILRNAAGERIAATVSEVTPFKIPEDGIAAGQLMSFVMGFVLEFKHDSPPEFLTIEQNMVAEGALLPSEMKILLKQAGSETPYAHMMKPAVPETFTFDWNQPPLAPDAPPEDWETWFENQRQKSLGIESYSSTYSFIYITNREVRHEVLVPLASLATLIDFERSDESFLTVAEQAIARRQIEAFFGSGNPVSVDGETIQPHFDRIDFYGLDLRDFAMQAAARKVSMASGRVGVIMSYPAAVPPKSVSVTWDIFNSAIKSVDAVVFALDETLTTEFSKFLENNTFNWQASAAPELPELTTVAANVDPKYLTPTKWQTSVVSLVLIAFAVALILFRMLSRATRLTWGRTLLTAGIAVVTSLVVPALGAIEIPLPFAQPPKFEIQEEQAREIFDQLHENIFHAFDYRTESDIYDALSRSVAGEQLRKLYLDVNQSLTMQSQGGAVAKIESVQRLEGQLSETQSKPRDNGAKKRSDQPRPEFCWRCRWNLAGTVEHWGHVHERINQYDAIFRIQLSEADAPTWKIVDMQMLDEKTGVVKTSLRTLATSAD